MAGAGHAIAVGASGMLAGACRGLADRGWTVTVVARTERRLQATTGDDPRLLPLPADYRATEFEATLAAAVEARGLATLALCWIHSGAPRALPAVVKALAPSGRLMHVLSSASQDPTDLGNPELIADRTLRYQRVILGYRVEGGRARWLTDGEIGGGALAAVDDPTADPYVVGQIHPWSARP
ncbi:hypothetical protein JQS43_00985 [Natronosporangium hydrolyticum]|uniref:Short-chain dehydrogenase n=1 Tax=Natronosporangium hydrolyticum TaxID=2811111 RepID=A0A895YB70_9ACTN|nr:hypothetical protein [Natronosporangium hydrolyticum]QSB14997.1 hypothetical protein JQS43_00985 [Natronosporangium hydrolyticum]